MKIQDVFLYKTLFFLYIRLETKMQFGAFLLHHRGRSQVKRINQNTLQAESHVANRDCVHSDTPEGRVLNL